MQRDTISHPLLGATLRNRPAVSTLALLFALTTVAGALAATAAPVAAQPSSLVISEIMYNPVSDDDDHEFVEIFNPGSEAVALAGIGFTDGIDFTFDGGSLAPQAHLVLSRNPAETASTYGTDVAGTYSGKLDNGGERLVLSAPDGSILDTVRYGDDGSWPVGPDGGGESLSLVDPARDNDDPLNWVGAAPNPGRASPTFERVRFGELSVDPPWPSPLQSPIVEVRIEGSDSATLVYRVMFGPEVTVPMERTAAGTFRAALPPQPAGTLTRFRIEAGRATLPAADDSRQDLGVVVRDQVTTNLPTLEIFVTDADYELLQSAESRLGEDEVQVPATLAYDGIVHTGVRLSIRGGGYARANFAKQSYDVDFPTGHKFDAPRLFDYPVDEFALKSDFSVFRGFVAWSIFEAAGFWKYHTFPVRVQKNGRFHAHYRVKEKLDDTWRARNDIDGQFFKAEGGFKYGRDGGGWTKTQPDDGDYGDIEAMRLFLGSNPSAAELWDVVDIPNAVNYWATSAVARHQDQDHHNKFVHFDDGDTELWQLVPWDLDHVFGIDGNEPCTGAAMVTLECLGHPFFDALWRHDDFRAMYFRRLRTVADQVLDPPFIEDVVAEVRASYGADAALEAAAWGTNPATTGDLSFEEEVAKRRSILSTDERLPASQRDFGGVMITEIHYHPQDGASEFVELSNPSDRWVDLSGVRLEGVNGDASIGGGIVIAPRGHLVLTDRLRTFRDLHEPGADFGVIQYDGNLSNGGEALRLVAPDGTELDRVVYDDTPPWETLPDGSAFSLELSDLGLDNARADAWHASTVENGTPGRPNSSSRRTAVPAVEPTIANATSLAQLQAADDYDQDRHEDVLRLYYAFFDRAPDVMGARYWLSEITDRQGADLDTIAYQFAASEEFQNTYGSVDDRRYLEILYRNVLLREPDANGFRYWLDLLEAGELDRGSVVRWVAAGTEFSTRVAFPDLTP